MAEAKNKIKFGIKNVHYAMKTADGWGTPKPMKGAVSVTLTPQGELVVFYADNIKYYQAEANNGYNGDLEMAVIDDETRVDLLGESITEDDKVLIERVNPTSNEFALGFEIDGDIRASRYWFYNCVAKRPTVEAETKKETVDPKTDTLSLSTSAGDDGIVRAKTTEDTTEAVYNNWFKSVYVKTA